MAVRNSTLLYGHSPPRQAPLLKIKQDIHGVPIGIRPQPVTALGVMDGHLAENLRVWFRQHREQLLKISIVENLSRCEFPRLTQSFFRIER